MSSCRKFIFFTHFPLTFIWCKNLGHFVHHVVYSMCHQSQLMFSWATRGICPFPLLWVLPQLVLQCKPWCCVCIITVISKALWLPAPLRNPTASHALCEGSQGHHARGQWACKGGHQVVGAHSEVTLWWAFQTDPLQRRTACLAILAEATHPSEISQATKIVDGPMEDRVVHVSPGGRGQAHHQADPADGTCRPPSAMQLTSTTPTQNRLRTTGWRPDRGC